MLTYAESNDLIYELFGSEECVEIEDALDRIHDIETKNDDISELLCLLEDLNSCEGRYIQEGKTDTYSADVDIYLKNSVPYCLIEYDNYSGTLSEAPIEYSEDQNVLFITEPIGEFRLNEHQFVFLISPDTLTVTWGTSKYILSRDDEYEPETEETRTSFAETQEYLDLTEQITSVFSSHNCAFEYNEEDHELFVYVEFGSDYKQMLISKADTVRSKWKELLDSVADISERIATVIDLNTRIKVADIYYGYGSCTITVVNSLNNSNTYSVQDKIAIVKDGTITYNCLDYVNSSGTTSESVKNSSTSSHTPTTGERNALRAAKEYLEVMAFSRNGLIEQLKYEGYSFSDATYAVDNCGANWNTQAAKCAKAYLEIMAFSRSKLISQLEYEGFTHEQAVYGASMNGY